MVRTRASCNACEAVRSMLVCEEGKFLHLVEMLEAFKPHCAHNQSATMG